MSAMATAHWWTKETMNERPDSPNGQEDSGEEQEAQTPKQRSAWARKEAELAAARREAAEARQAAGQLTSLQQQNAQLQQRLQQIELAQQTAGLPEEQRNLAVLQAQLQEAVRQNRQMQEAIDAERQQWQSFLTPMAREKVARKFIKDYDLPPKIETPLGTEDMDEWLASNPRSVGPDEMEALARQVANNLKRNGTAVAPKAAASGGKFLGAGGAGAGSVKRKTADELTPAEVGQVRTLMREKGYGFAQGMQAWSQGERATGV